MAVATHSQTAVVVLSAGETGLGEVVQGEGLIGLTQQNLRPAEALRAAQLEMF